MYFTQLLLLLLSEFYHHKNHSKDCGNLRTFFMSNNYDSTTQHLNQNYYPGSNMSFSDYGEDHCQCTYNKKDLITIVFNKIRTNWMFPCFNFKFSTATIVSMKFSSMPNNKRLLPYSVHTICI